VRYTKGDRTAFHAVLKAVISSEEKAAVTKQPGSWHVFCFQAMQ
jgi:hypothetical protein